MTEEAWDMGVPYGYRFEIPFDVMFPRGLFLIGELQPLMDYLSQEDKVRSRRARHRTDEITGFPMFKGMFADPAGDRDKSLAVEFASPVQPVPPAVPGVPLTPVVLEGLRVQPRAEASGQTKWITWVVRATGMLPVNSSADAKAA